jgi:glycosyltransferase involved in cell wall biosynthesis
MNWIPPRRGVWLVSEGSTRLATAPTERNMPSALGRDILIADNPGEFAGAVVGLLQDRARRSEIGRAARELVAREYSWESVGRCFEAVMATLVRTDSVAHDDNLRPEKASVAR